VAPQPCCRTRDCAAPVDDRAQDMVRCRAVNLKAASAGCSCWHAQSVGTFCSSTSPCCHTQRKAAYPGRECCAMTRD
jgi:hypothetical protein